MAGRERDLYSDKQESLNKAIDTLLDCGVDDKFFSEDDYEYAIDVLFEKRSELN